MESLLRNLMVVPVSQAGFPVNGSKENKAGSFWNGSLRLLTAGVKSAMENDGRIILWAASQRQCGNQIGCLFLRHATRMLAF
jgi:hypothetical protein